MCFWRLFGKLENIYLKINIFYNCEEGFWGRKFKLLSRKTHNKIDRYNVDMEET
jgi:hypothetical protein